MTVRVRFAPSPTGYLHIGGARTALFNALYAKHCKGTFILRIEDTDRERSTQEAIDAIVMGMTWLGLAWDEGPYFQTERFAIYQEKVDELLAAGKAYRCFCTLEELEAFRQRASEEKRKPKYSGICRRLTEEEIAQKMKQGLPYSIRFKAPETGETLVHDLVRGVISFANVELDDLIIRRASDGSPTYNFTVVIDDALMGITHVIRGDDHLNNTPRQIQMYEALGYPLPEFVHVPMILGADKKRLSKRHGATSVLAYRDMGYLPEALLNYLVRLGWSSGNQEIFTWDELLQKFDLTALTKSPAVFNPEKLLWMNGIYMRAMPASELATRTVPFLHATGIHHPDFELLEKAVKVSQGKTKTLVELAQMIAFFFKTPSPETTPLLAELLQNPLELARLKIIHSALAGEDNWTHEGLKALFARIGESEGLSLKDLAQPLRLYMTGASVSPGIFEVLEVLGKAETLERLGAIS